MAVIKLSIIIVNYNTGALTKACLESILKQDLPRETEIIIVDNNSSDESVTFLRSDFPEARVIVNKTNIGLAGGVNIGLKEAKGEYKLILNPDIIVLPGALKTLTTFMDAHPRVGVSGGKLISPNGLLQYSCYRFYRLITIIYRRTWLGRTKTGQQEIRRFLMKDFDHQSVRDVDWLMGACLMVRSSALDKVGGMDELFFLYFEDVDWCRRFWEKGYRVTYVPSAQFSHYHQRSSEQASVIGLLFNRAARHHIFSAIKYFWKYRFANNPHT